MRWLAALFAAVFFAAVAVAAETAPPVPDVKRQMQDAADKQRVSVARQREAIRVQAKTLGVWLLPGAPPLDLADPIPPCEPIADADLTPLIESAAKTQEIQPKLLRAVAEQESGLLPCAESPKGAQGLMQLMPGTADELGVEDPFDPKESIDAGAKFLKQLLDRYAGDVSKALGAYNAGPAAADEAGGIPDIPETQDYVKAILGKLVD